MGNCNEIWGGSKPEQRRLLSNLVPFITESLTALLHVAVGKEESWEVILQRPPVHAACITASALQTQRGGKGLRLLSLHLEVSEKKTRGHWRGGQWLIITWCFHKCWTGLAFPLLPLLLLPSISIFFKPCLRWKCNSLAWMNTDIDLSKLLSHFKLSDS